VGAGATTTTELTPAQIEGIGSFWWRWFERSGAQVEFYGANLALPDRGGGLVNIGQPKRTIEIEPVTVPVPEEVPVEEPVPAEPEKTPAPVEEPARGIKR
jgi:hypothetical protein